MATEESPQRAYRAACPGCGAPVLFRSAQSTHAVCSFCQSTVVRNGETLERIGKMAEVFNDFSPLQLFASGKWNGKGFTLIGRLQYQYGEGSWSEWIASMDDGSTAVLSEDNGAFVFATPASSQRGVPAAAQFRVGATTAINGKSYTIASNAQASLMAAQGELPRLPPLGMPFAVVELRSDDGEVLSIDYGPQVAGGEPALSQGKAVQLDDLELRGLRDESAKEEKAQQFDCPNCGAQVEVALATSKSITCRACDSLIDLTQGTGGALQHALQDEPVQPLIPLGTVGQLQGVHWQVVGFQHRMGHDPEDADEHFGWSEYLLFHKKKGFTFLVDSEEGWSMVKPVTGAPSVKGNTATYLDSNYQLKYSYNAETTYVAGEFYWQVQRGQKTFNRDFAKGANLLSMEQSANEVAWSFGSTINSALVAAAFKLKDAKLLERSDASPVSFKSGISVGTIIIIFVVLMILSAVLTSCDDNCDPTTQNCSSSGSNYRSSGGSFGGFSGGGGHK
jgi:hypothetical protein